MRRLASFERILFAVTAIVVAALVQVGIGGLPVLPQSKSWLLDFKRGTFRAAADRPREDIALVAITPQTLAGQRSRDPIDNAVLADIVTKAAARGPRAIGIDVIPRETDPASDARLVASVNAAVAADIPVIVGWAAQTPIPRALLGARWQYGDVTPELDEDLIWRRRSTGDIGTDGMARLGFPSAVLDGVGAAFDTGSETSIDFVRSAAEGAPFRTIAAELPDYPEDAVRGRIVLVGTDLPFRERYRTPLIPAIGERAGTLSSLQIQAQAIAQLIDHRLVTTLGPVASLVLATIATLLGMLLPLADVGRWRKAAAALLLLAGLWLASGLAVRFVGIDIPLFASVFCFLIGAGLCSLYIRYRHRDERVAISRAFAGHVGSAVQQQILADPNAVSTRGSVRDVVVLRCEIPYFESLAESLPPDELVARISRLQQRITALAWEHGGTIVGQRSTGMTILFGAPLALPKAGEKALSCGLAIVQAAHERSDERLESLTAPSLAVRVALHAGPVVVGDFCGDANPLYDAVGPTIAMAERLLDLGPVLDVPLLASYEAAGRAQGTTFRPIGTFELPEGQGALEVFIPLARSEAKGPVAASYFKGVEALRHGDTETARLAFRSALEADPADGPTRFHVLRLESGGSGMRLPWPLAA
jgi:adenylate cyclase